VEDAWLYLTGRDEPPSGRDEPSPYYIGMEGQGPAPTVVVVPRAGTSPAPTIPTLQLVPHANNTVMGLPLLEKG